MLFRSIEDYYRDLDMELRITLVDQASLARTAQMTQRYAHLTEQHQSALVRKMAARVLPSVA